jgi:adenine-specific DNA-methyltransferase
MSDNGQYFTTNEELQEKVFSFIKNKSTTILEPCIGQGHLIKYVTSKNPKVQFDMYEIDKSIELLDGIKSDEVKYCDFLETDIVNTYDTIIGNPPFVQTKKGNLYQKFIEKCYRILKAKGELIFIVPSDFIKLTSSGSLINEMMENGTFTHLFQPNNEHLFNNANVDVIIFRYCKNPNLTKKVEINGKKKFLINTNGVLTFSEKNMKNSKMLSQLFDIYVGMVTGKENVFKNQELGNMEVINGKNKIDKYIMLTNFPSENEELDTYMLSHKEGLLSRKIRKFNDKNWFEWGGLRNYDTIKKHLEEECLYVRTLTREKEVCFKDKVRFVGGGLIILIPKQGVEVNMEKVLERINSEDFQSNYTYSGRFKIGHHQLCNVLYSD